MNYHDWLYYTLWTISILAGIWAITMLFATNDFGMFAGVSVILALFIGFFGWFLLGNVHESIDLNIEVNARVIKTDSSIILTVYDRPIQTLTDVSSYNLLKDKTNVVMIQHNGINIYGYTNFHECYTIKQ